MNKIDYNQYMDYCKSDKEKAVFELSSTGMKQKEIAKNIEVHPRTVRKILKRVKDRASVQGYNPEFGLRHKIPDNLLLKGTSALWKKNEHGEQVKVLEWIKTSKNAEAIAEVIEGIIEALKEDIPKAKMVEYNDSWSTDKDLIPIVVLTDMHLGMIADVALTGENVTLESATEQVMAMLEIMFSRIPKTDRILLVDLGDGVHSEVTENVTMGSGHALDGVLNYQDMITAYIKVLRFTIETALKNYKNVDLVIAPANHSRSVDLTMKPVLEQMYEGNSDRFTVLENSNPFIGYRMDDVFIMITHGDKGKGRHTDIMATDFKEHFNCTYKYVYSGHFHTGNVKNDKSGVIQEVFPQFGASDAYAFNGGWRSKKLAHCVLMHRYYGDSGRISISREEVIDKIKGGVVGQHKQAARIVHTV